MQGSNDVPFAGSLHRKSSHTTYGRKGRASLAAKDGQGTGSRASSQGPQAESGSDNVDSRKHQPPSKPASELDRDGASKPKSSGTAETASLGAIGVKRKGTGEETLLGDKSQASGFSSGLENKRRRITPDAQSFLSFKPTAAKTSLSVMSPSSDLSELPSDPSDAETSLTPKTNSYQGKPSRGGTLQTTQETERATAPPEHTNMSAPETPPTSTTFLPAIIPSPKQILGSQPSALPFRRKARMLTRAESFGRTEAQKDQMEAMKGETDAKGQVPVDRPNDLALALTDKPGLSSTPLTPRRALARSTTLATVNVSPSGRSRAPLTRTASMPTSPAKTTIGQAHAAELERLPSASNLGVPVKRTYGRARMAESRADIDQESGQIGTPMETLSPVPQSSLDGEGSNRISPEKPLLEQRESYADLVKRLEMDEDEDMQDWDESAGSMDYLRNAKSLAELRSRGENRKFMDDLTWLLEGLDDDSLSVRRSSAIDLLDKMSGPGWFEKLRVCGQVDDIYSRLSVAREKSTDLGFDLSLLEYLAYVAKAPNALILILGNHLESVLAFVLYVLQSPSVAFESASGNSKRKKSPALQTLSNLRTLLDLNDVNDVPLSASAMSMMVISTAIRHCLSGHIEPPSMKIQQKLCAVMAEEVHQQLRILPERLEMYEKGLDLFSNGTDVDIAFIDEAIDVFSAMTKTWPIVRTQFENRHCDLATDLANLLLIVQFDSTALNGFKDSQALRLLVTPTLTSRDWSRAILQSVAPGSLVLRYLVDSSARGSSSSEDSGRNREEQPDSTPDTAQAGDRDVSLPLGLLYNLMDVAEDGGQALLLETEFFVQCTRAKRCIRQCKCSGREPAVRHLCELFNRQQDKRNDNPSAAFLAGYLTLLFTKCLQNQPCRNAILANVSGPDPQSKINTLQDCLQQFAEVYDSAQSRLQQILPTEEGEIGAERENIMPTIQRGLDMLGSILD